MDRRLPQGYGQGTGPDAAIRNAESQALRRALIPTEGGWLISTLGDIVFAHHDVTGVLLTAELLQLCYIPERTGVVQVAEARLNVATAVVATSIETALFIYDKHQFTRIPGTLAKFDSTSTGLKTVTLKAPTDIPPNAKLFLGLVAHGGTPAVEGFQSGAGASPRVIRQRTVSAATVLNTGYTLGQTTVNTGDTPMVAYLSSAAALVL